MVFTVSKIHISYAQISKIFVPTYIYFWFHLTQSSEISSHIQSIYIYKVIVILQTIILDALLRLKKSLSRRELWNYVNYTYLTDILMGKWLEERCRKPMHGQIVSTHTNLIKLNLEEPWGSLDGQHLYLGHGLDKDSVISISCAENDSNKNQSRNFLERDYILYKLTLYDI